MAAPGKQEPAAVRRNRYARSSTISVTQLLTDSCSSLLQRLTTRVRGPSQTDNRHATTANTASTSAASSSVSHGSISHGTENSLLGATRSRLEDKYSAVLERLAGKRRDPERTLEPSVSKTMEKRANPLMKSATTTVIPEIPLMKSATSVVLSEKQYPYVSAVGREKTPYKSTHRLSQHNSTQNHYPEPPYAYLDHHSAYNMRHKTTNMPELRPRRSSKPLHKVKSNETLPTLKLCPVEIPNIIDEPSLPSSSRVIDDEKTPTNSDIVDPQIVEREARRKEIQSLIMKYSALDEAYNKATMNAAINTVTSPVKVPEIQKPEPPPHNIKIAKKYQPPVVALTVSNRMETEHDFFSLRIQFMNLFFFFYNTYFNETNIFNYPMERSKFNFEGYVLKISSLVFS